MLAETSKRPNQRFARSGGDLANRLVSHFADALFRFGAYSPEPRDGQGGQELFNVLLLDDNKAIRFLQIGGDLRKELVRCETNRGRQTSRLTDFLLDVHCDLFGRSKQRDRAGDVEESFDITGSVTLLGAPEQIAVSI